MKGIGLKTLYRAAYVYLALPMLVFFAGWLNYGAAFALILLTGVCLYKICAETGKTENAGWRLPKRFLFFLTVVATIWCFLAGIGYFYYQSFDYHFRNAVFRDLINYSWPVFYDKADTPLVYYMGFWLLPALFGKISAPFIQNAYWNFYLANIWLYIYAVAGVILILALLAAAVRADSWKKLAAAVVIFVFFSGMDVIGILFFKVVEQPFAYHLDWWATFIQYSSLTTCLFWVFNQFIPTALVMLLMFNERNIKNFGFLVAATLFFAPYPAAGIGIFAVACAGRAFWLSKDKTSFLGREIFSIPNLIGAFWLLPTFVLYFITNSEGMDKLWYVFDYTTPMRLLIFMLLEFLLIAGLLAPTYRKHLFFVTAVAALCLIPFFRLDQQNNFCMRASIPPLIVLCIYTIRFLTDSFSEHRNVIRRTLLLVLLLIGAATPLTEFYRGLHFTRQLGRLNIVADQIYTLNQPFVQMPVFGWDANHQFTAKEYRSDIFWQYLSRKHRPDTSQ